jgi:hypothetical protein
LIASNHIWQLGVNLLLVSLQSLPFFRTQLAGDSTWLASVHLRT